MTNGLGNESVSRREREKKLASTGLELLCAVNLICLECFCVADITACSLRLPKTRIHAKYLI